ncbi:glycosyl hydrolases family 16-domain-containing protein [Lactarius indigo]|nr:glycosyl hydrolases family 16-domain-containing protein [Lactarius indigo]
MPSVGSLLQPLWFLWPNPICQSTNYTFTDQTRIYSNASLFDGNAAAYDWVLNQGDVSITNSSGGELVLMHTQNNGGTRISSTRYVHYGKITAMMKTGRWNGVVTAFATMSNVKDEIDWGFPGASTTSGQRIFYWQGNIPAETQSVVENGDTYSDYCSFTINWQPNNLTFLLDNKACHPSPDDAVLHSNKFMASRHQHVLPGHN